MDLSNITPAQVAALLAGPSLAPPGDILPNFVNPPNKNGLALGLAIASIALTVPTVLLRLYSRLFCVRLFKLEDFIGLAAFAMYIGVVQVVLDMATHHPGYLIHQWDIPLKDLEHIIKKFLLGIVFYNLTMIFSKTAILLEWVRIFVPAKRNAFFWTAYTLILLNALLYVAGTIIAYLVCIPLEKYWRPWVPGTCIDRTLADFVSTGLNTIIDLTILILPQQSIWRLNMRPSRKVGISLVFSIGVLACAAAIGRIQSAVHAYKTHDHIYYGGETLLWSLAESTFAMLVFHVVGVPKAFDSNGPLAGFMTSLLSWSRVSSSNVLRSSTKGQSRDEWKQREDVSLEPTGSYHHLDDSNAIRLVQTAHINSKGIPRSDDKIVRTTEFEALSIYDEIDTRSGSGYTHLNDRQHPWASYNEETSVDVPKGLKTSA